MFEVWDCLFLSGLCSWKKCKRKCFLNLSQQLTLSLNLWASLSGIWSGDPVIYSLLSLLWYLLSGVQIWLEIWTIIAFVLHLSRDFGMIRSQSLIAGVVQKTLQALAAIKSYDVDAMIEEPFASFFHHKIWDMESVKRRIMAKKGKGLSKFWMNRCWKG